MAQHYIACDLGASSGRVMLGTLDDGKISLEEIHRFNNGPLQDADGLKWDISQIIGELETGVRKVVACGIQPLSISTDSWGVDYVWVGDGGRPLCKPFHYRDSRTDGAVQALSKTVPLAEIFGHTGIQFMDINTLYQLLDDKRRRPELFGESRGFLNIGDYVNHHFCGSHVAEMSLASTTQLLDPSTRNWSSELIAKVGLPERIFPRVVPSGSRLGTVRGEVAGRLGLDSSVEVIASCSHDTGAAVAAVPARGRNWAYLSSGTWSLLGIELDQPVICDRCRELNFTNEAGFAGTIRLLKNIVGLWIVQECRRVWQEQGRNYSYSDFAELAAVEQPVRSLIRPDDGRFLKSGDMPERIRQFCRETGQPVPENDGAVIRAAYDSLALSYRETADQLTSLTGLPIETLHVVGGGSRDTLLNQLTADALNLPVIAGPEEATATGNILIQAVAMGHLESPAVIRETVSRSFEFRQFSPKNPELYADAAERFRTLHRNG